MVKNEETIKTNPRGADQCSYEKQSNPQKCSGCDGTDVFDQLLCCNLTMKWRLAQIDKTLQAILTTLNEIKNK
jgi:hypothetical protein